MLMRGYEYTRCDENGEIILGEDGKPETGYFSLKADVPVEKVEKAIGCVAKCVSEFEFDYTSNEFIEFSKRHLHHTSR